MHDREQADQVFADRVAARLSPHPDCLPIAHLDGYARPTWRCRLFGHAWAFRRRCCCVLVKCARCGLVGCDWYSPRTAVDLARVVSAEIMKTVRAAAHLG